LEDPGVDGRTTLILIRKKIEYEGAGCIYQVLHRAQWPTLVNTVMNNLIPEKENLFAE
jgi:hypothetical protein